MFFIFSIFHGLIFLESFLIYKKKLPKKSKLVFISNCFFLFLNTITLFKTISANSSLDCLKNNVNNNPVIHVLWILINILFLVFINYIIKYISQKKKQNPYLKIIIYIFTNIIILSFIILLFSKKSNFFVLLYILFLYFRLIKAYIKNQQNIIIVALILISLGIWYSYFTYLGAARLEILLNGYPKEAYDIGLDEFKYFNEKNIKKYIPVEQIKLENGEITMIEVRRYGFIKIGIANINE